jgi:uncharacterized membrane protein YkvA (DUF1232 family)
MAKEKLRDKAWVRTAVSMGLSLATNKEKLNVLIGRFYDKKTKKLKFDGVNKSINSLRRMIRAYVRGEYKNISPWLFINTGIGILYLVVNADLIPDKLYDLGFMDELAVLLWMIDTFADEIEKFEYWEVKQIIKGIQIA